MGNLLGMARPQHRTVHRGMSGLQGFLPRAPFSSSNPGGRFHYPCGLSLGKPGRHAPILRVCRATLGATECLWRSLAADRVVYDKCGSEGAQARRSHAAKGRRSVLLKDDV